MSNIDAKDPDDVPDAWIIQISDTNSTNPLVIVPYTVIVEHKQKFNSKRKRKKGQKG